MGWLAKLTEDVGAIFSINIEPIDNAQLIEHLDARDTRCNKPFKNSKK